MNNINKLADVIVLCSTRNKKIEEFQINMIDSFVSNTSDDCKLFIVENNSDNFDTKNWEDYIKTKKQNFFYSKSDFNMNKMYNEATKLTNKKFVMYANSDILFHNDWYYNLINWFDKIDNLFVISPFTKAFGWTPEQKSVYRNDIEYLDVFIESIQMPGWFYCFQRESNFIWDEQFKAHYQDNDVVNILNDMKRKNPLVKSGFAYNSRVDHLGGMTHKNANVDYFNSEGREKIIKKWGENHL
jgi:hypothetical protein